MPVWHKLHIWAYICNRDNGNAFHIPLKGDGPR